MITFARIVGLFKTMSTDALSKKKRTRGGHRSAVTRLIPEVKDALSAVPSDRKRVSQLKRILDEKLATLKQLDEEILDMVEEAAVADEIEQADSCKEQIFAYLIDLEESLSKSSPPSGTGSTTHTSGLASASSGARVKLPKLAIRPFDGNITKWTSFWDSFVSAIDSSPGLSTIDKFNYLRSLLEKSAAESISGLTLTADNYKEAVSILKRRFGNKQQIISKHMDALLHLEAVSSQNNLKGLRHLYDLVETQVRGLKSLGVESNSYGSLLSSVLIQKIPPELQLILSREVGERSWNLDDLLQRLQEEIAARERVGAPSAPTKKVVKDGSVSTAATLLSPNNTPQSNAPTCSYCQQRHPSGCCKVVTDVGARRQILMRAGRCFVCLGRYHISKQCRHTTKCRQCGGRHHYSICSRPADATLSAPRSENPHPVNSTPSQGLDPQVSEFQPTATNLYTSANMGVLLQTARTKVFNPQRPQSRMTARVILDSGSQRSYITCKARATLSLPTVRTQRMSIKTFGSTQEEDQHCDVVRIALKTVDGKTLKLQLFVVPLICEPLTNQLIDRCKSEHQHLTHLQLADSSDGGIMPVDILIGSDCYWEIATDNVIRGEKGPTAVYTKLGWVLSGPSGSFGNDCAVVNIVTSHILRVDAMFPVEELDSTLKSFWELESLGIGDDRSVLEDFSDKITFDSHRYQVSLPWKESHPVLPNNRILSERRLRGLLHRLSHNLPILQEYDTLIKEQLKSGVVEEVKEEAAPTGAVHYLPHHAVIRRDKETTKLRVVYDASARADGPSLNDCLYAGPKFEQNILDIILRFRTHKIALIADIEKAFLQIAVNKEDRDALRFLWVDDVSKTEPTITSLRFTRVPFGVTSSPFLLNATVQHHLNQYAVSLPEAVQKISRSIYVDDIATGSDSENKAYQLYADSKVMLREGGFNLRKFLTNSSELQERIEESEKALQLSPQPRLGEDLSYTQSTLGTTQTVNGGETKVLGVKWNPSTDRLVFDLSDVTAHALDMEPTKRNVIGIACRFYDPVGFVSPVTIRFKMLFQELCRAGLDWDQPLTPDLLAKWQDLMRSLHQTPLISISRCYFDKLAMETTIRLVGFCDASKTAYAAVVYLAIDSDLGHDTRFVSCKTRVAPLKEQSIPRLELLSALLLSRLMTSVFQALEPELNLDRSSYFTDSTVALYWIKRQEKEWKPFIQNRVNQIRKLTAVAEWHHCPGTDNPADIPSRGADPHQLSNSTLWLHGPEWLQNGSISPDHCGVSEMPEACRMEQKKSGETHNLLTASTAAGEVKIGELIKPDDFSSKERLLNLTARVIKCARIWKQKSKPTEDLPDTITPADLQEAENYWIRDMQESLKTDPKFSTWQKQFGLFVDDDGLWRCGGRLTKAELPFNTRHPVLLHQRHHFTTLIVRDAHGRVKHNGVKETLTELRSGYWIIRGRSFVRKVIHRCVVCRRYEGKSYVPPPPPPLPSFRVTEAPAFTFTGVDYAGPLYVKGTSGEDSEKAWICLFTCCVVRAIHLEVVSDMTTQSFIRCFKRFTARRGFPVKMISDNALTFKAAAKELTNILKHPELDEFLSGLRVQWSFNLEKAPWWGGIFERMVKSVKRCLRKTIGREKLTLDELNTAVIEVEAIVNSRPLTYVSTEDVEEPVTPSHLIAGRRLMSLPDGPYNRDIDDDAIIEHATLTKRMIHLSKVLDHFWRRWTKEYLLELREVHRLASNRSKSATPRISVGDIVLVQDTDRPRGFWRLARVEKLISGTDGQVRGASVRLHSSGRQHTHLQRAVQCLYPLEVSSCAGVEPLPVDDSEVPPSTTDGGNCDERIETVDQPNTEPRRPKRMAARNARAIMQVLTEED